MIQMSRYYDLQKGYHLSYVSNDCIYHRFESMVCNLQLGGGGGGGILKFTFGCPAVNNFTCTDGEIKLIGGDADYEGTIQMCLNNTFGTICDDRFNSLAAGVVCSSLGYPRQGKRAVGGTYPYKWEVWYLYNMVCAVGGTYLCTYM